MGKIMKSKWLKRGLWALVWVVSLGSLFYAEENWRGAKAWKAYEAELRAKGEPLTIQEMLPERPPDDLNMAMAPVFAGMFDFKTEWNPVRKQNELIPVHPEIPKRNEAIALPGKLASGIDPALGQGPDLKKIREACEKETRNTSSKVPVASAIPSTLADGPYLLEAMRLRAELYRQVEEAAARPQVYWPIRYEEGVKAQLPHLGNLLVFAKAFALKAVVLLDAGKTGDAYRDWQVVQRLAESQTGQPLLISHLVGLSMENLSQQVVWEGLRRGAWSEAQLRDIEARLAEKNLARDFQQSMRGERAVILALLSEISYRRLFSLISPVDVETHFVGESLAFTSIYWRPQGWLDLEKREYARLMQDTLISGLVFPSGRYDVARFEESSEKVKKSINSWLDLMGKPILYMVIPALAPSASQSALAEARIRQTILACALERYRQLHGSYPERLDVLDVDPRFRRDPVTEGDMVYRLDNGGYVIYSLGWNLKDDGGAYEPKKKNNGDWPWRMPGAAEGGRQMTEGGTQKK